MLIYHAYAAEHRADNTQIALICASNEEVGPGCYAVMYFKWAAVYSAFSLAGKALNG